MKRYKNMLAALVLLLLLGLGYGIPLVVMAVEDQSMLNTKKSVEIEEIELDTYQVNLEEELLIFPDLLMKHIVVEEGSHEIAGTRNYNMVTSAVDAFLQFLNKDISISFEKMTITYYAITADEVSGKIYPLWRCIGVDDDKNKYAFWIDDVSEKVVAFQVPVDAMGISLEDFYDGSIPLENYYGFMQVVLSEIEEDMAWEQSLGEFEVKISLTERLFQSDDMLVFNYYSGGLSIYNNMGEKEM